MGILVLILKRCHIITATSPHHKITVSQGQGSSKGRTVRYPGGVGSFKKEKKITLEVGKKKKITLQVGKKKKITLQVAKNQHWGCIEKERKIFTPKGAEKKKIHLPTR